jgi:hypothetical protein
MGRLLSAGSLVRDQIDLYLPSGSINRIQGYALSGLSLALFFNNSPVAWPLADGTLVPDSSVSAGTVYFNEIQGSPGFYSVRFFPDAVGFWRIVLTAAPLQTERVLSYDVAPAGSFKSGQGGLIASFVE